MNNYYKDNTKVVKDIEAATGLLAFMAFNLSEEVIVNRFYFSHNEITFHFSFRNTDWLLKRQIGSNEWYIQKHKGYRFTLFNKQDIIEGKF